MSVELTVRWWRANEPKLVKHMEWEKDVAPALASWESSKKNVESGSGDMAFYYKKLLDWGAHLKSVLKAKHDWLNRVTHAESRKKIDQLIALLDQEMRKYEAQAKAESLVREKETNRTRTPNTGRPLPMRPPAKGAF